jgi:hypothetical protein
MQMTYISTSLCAVVAADAGHRRLARRLVGQGDELRRCWQVARVAAAVELLIPRVRRRTVGRVACSCARHTCQEDDVPACAAAGTAPAADTRSAFGTVRTAHAPRRCGRPNQPLATARCSATEQAHCQIVAPRLRDAVRAVVDARLRSCGSVRIVVIIHHAFTVLVEQPERGVQRSAADGGRAEGIGVADVNGVDIDIVGAADGAANLRDGVAACALRGFGQVARVAAAVVSLIPAVERRCLLRR